MARRTAGWLLLAASLVASNGYDNISAWRGWACLVGSVAGLGLIRGWGRKPKPPLQITVTDDRWFR